MNELLQPIVIKLHPTEAARLVAAMSVMQHNVKLMREHAPLFCIVIAEWYQRYGMNRLLTLSVNNFSKKPKTLRMPVSVAKAMMQELGSYQHDPFIVLVLGYLHKELVDRGLWVEQ